MSAPPQRAPELGAVLIGVRALVTLMNFCNPSTLLGTWRRSREIDAHAAQPG